MVALIMAKCGVSAQTALQYAQTLRPIVDIQWGAHGSTVLPMTFLATIAEGLWAMFRDAGVPQWKLPVVVTPALFMLMLGDDWSRVPEHVEAYVRPTPFGYDSRATPKPASGHGRPSLQLKDTAGKIINVDSSGEVTTTGPTGRPCPGSDSGDDILYPRPAG